MESRHELLHQSNGKDEDKEISPKGSTNYLPAIPEGGSLQGLISKGEEALVKVAEKTSGKAISKKSRHIIKNFLQRNSHGYPGSLEMICQGPQCPFLSSCPLHEAGSALPIGSKCPVESILVEKWVNKHLIALGIRDVFAPENSFDMDMLYELAAQQLIQWRCGVHLSDQPGLVSREVVATSQMGEPIFSDVINPVLEIMDRSGKNVSKLREALLATRKAQIQAGKDMADPSKTIADLRKKALGLLKERQDQQEEVQDAEYEVKE